MWLIILSDQLSIVDLVGFYPANCLMDRRLIFRPRRFNNCLDVEPLHHLILVPLSRGYVPQRGMFLRVTHPSAAGMYRMVRPRSTCMPKAHR